MATHTRPSRRWVPLLLLLLSLTISGFAVQRGHHAVKSQRETAESLLRDYGAFAAWSYGQAISESIDGAIRSVLSPARVAFLEIDEPTPCLEDILAEATAGSDCRCASPVGGRYAFLLRMAPTPAAPVFAGERPAAREWVLIGERLAQHAREEYGANWPYAVLHIEESDVPFTLAYARLTNAAGDTLLYGFEIDFAALGTHLGDVHERQHLLPPSLTHDLPNGELIAVNVVTPYGRSIFSSHPDAEARFVAEQPIERIHGGFTAKASIVPDAAGLLIIGGLPSSQIPWLLLVFAISAALALLALSQLRREGQLAALRADFVSSVSHELRTPLAQVRLFLETLRLDRYDTTAQRDWILSNIDRETKRLTHLVENVLHFSRAERGLALRPQYAADLSHELRDIVDAFAPLGAARRTRFVVDAATPVVARIDREAFRQVVLNLLDNAVKYGPAGQTVTLRAECTADGCALISIEDEGPGIDAADRRAIWQPFRRGRRAIGSVAVGSGIGLAVVRDIVERHEGRVWVERAPTGGARFNIELGGATTSAVTAGLATAAATEARRFEPPGAAGAESSPAERPPARAAARERTG